MKYHLPAVLSIVLVLSGCGREPQTLDELTTAGERAFLAKEYARARSYLGQAVARKPSDRHLLYLLGMSYSRDFLYDSAFYYLKRADLLYSGDREINHELLKIAVALQDWKAALEAIKTLVATGDSISQYYPQLAEYNLSAGNRSMALHYYRKLKNLNPENRTYILYTANLLVDMDSVDAALAVIDSAIARFGPQEEFLLNRSMYLTAAQRYGESEAILRELLAEDSANAPYKLNLANALASQDDRVKKEEALKLYLEIDTILGEQFRVDSMISVLKKELGVP